MLDIELCGLGATMVWEWCFQSCFVFYPRRWPHSHSKSICMWVCMFCNCCSFLCLCVILCLCDNVHNEPLTNLTWGEGV